MLFNVCFISLNKNIYNGFTAMIQVYFIQKKQYEYKYKHWAHAYFLDVVGPMSYQSGADKLSMLKWR